MNAPAAVAPKPAQKILPERKFCRGQQLSVFFFTCACKNPPTIERSCCAAVFSVPCSCEAACKQSWICNRTSDAFPRTTRPVTAIKLVTWKGLQLLQEELRAIGEGRQSCGGSVQNELAGYQYEGLGQGLTDRSMTTFRCSNPKTGSELQ